HFPAELGGHGWGEVNLSGALAADGPRNAPRVGTAQYASLLRPTSSLHEFIRIKLADRRLLPDDALGEIEILELGDPVDVDFTQHFLSWIDQRGVVFERRLDAAFLALPLRH